MKMMKINREERYTILLIPETGNPVKYLRFAGRRPVVWACAIILALGILLAGNLIVFGYLYVVDRAHVFRYLSFKSENARLTSAFRSEIPLLKDRYQELADQERRILDLAAEIETITGFRNFDPNDFLNASGGPAGSPRADTGGELTLERLQQQAEAASGERQGIQGRFVKIEMFLRADQDRMRHTPLGQPVNGWVSSAFGWRQDPWEAERSEYHSGMDISTSRGAPIRATADGTVRMAGPYGGYGQVVILTHAPPYETYYGHLSQVAVPKGGRIERGEVIGYAGSTGRATGVHTHYEIRYNSRAVDPWPYFRIVP